MTEKAAEMDGDLRSRMVSVEHSVQGNSQRLAVLEAWQRQRDIDAARHDEKWQAMESRIDTRFSGLERSVQDIQTSLSRINWLIIAGIISGIMAVLFKSGLTP